MSRPFCYVCSACDHPAHAHRLVSGGDLRNGPYRCHCGCEIEQSAPTYAWSASQFEAYKKQLAKSGRVEDSA